MTERRSHPLDLSAAAILRSIHAALAWSGAAPGGGPAEGQVIFRHYL